MTLQIITLVFAVAALRFAGYAVSMALRPLPPQRSDIPQIPPQRSDIPQIPAPASPNPATIKQTGDYDRGYWDGYAEGARSRQQLREATRTVEALRRDTDRYTTDKEEVDTITGWRN